MNFRKHLKFYFLLLVMALIAVNINSQQVRYLTLDSALNIAKEKSHRIRMLRETLAQATYRLRSLKLSYLPSLEFNGTIPALTENVVLNEQPGISEYYYKKNYLVAGDLSLNQVLPTNGTLSIITGGSNLKSYRDTTKLFKTNIGINYSQPIEAFYSYNQRKAEIKEAKLNYELALKQYKREELNLIYNISSLYYNLVSNQKQKDIAYQNLTRQEEANKLAQNKYETGLIKEVEALQIEVDLGEAINRFDVQSTSLDQAQNQLKMELDIPFTDSLIVDSKPEYKEMYINPEQAVELGLKNRTEIRESQIQIDLSLLDIKRQQSQGLITGNINAYYDFIGSTQYNDLEFPYREGFNSTITDMFGRSGNVGISLTVRIPILDWGANHQMVKLYKSRLKQNQISLDYQRISIENEIRNTVNRFNSSLRRLLILEKNVKLAEKSFEISYLRFTNGDIDAEALGLDRIRYNTAQQSYLDAYISYKLLLLDLNRKTFFDFATNTPIVPENL